jgi:hypothetical protein
MAEVIARALLKTQLITVRDVECEGRCRHHSDEESTNATHVVFPYRGIYVRHLGADDAVAEANQVLYRSNSGVASGNILSGKWCGSVGA